MPREWPPVDPAAKQAAIDAYLAGASSTEAAKHVNRSASTVLYWVRQAGYAVRGNPDEYDMAIVDDAVGLYLAGLSSQLVGEHLGVPGATVLRWVKRAGHDVRRQGVPSKVTPAGRERIVAMITGGRWSAERIALSLHLPVDVVRGWIDG